jgi:hypothetical protein
VAKKHNLKRFRQRHFSGSGHNVHHGRQVSIGDEALSLGRRGECRLGTSVNTVLSSVSASEREREGGGAELYINIVNKLIIFTIQLAILE